MGGIRADTQKKQKKKRRKNRESLGRKRQFRLKEVEQKVRLRVSKNIQM